MRVLQALILTLMLASKLATGQPNFSEAGPSAERYEILFMGNSHSAANGLPELLTKLIEAGLPNATAKADLAPGWKFLVDRLDDGVSEQMLNSRPWTHVILQAQKYSSSGQYFYPTTAAEEWIRRAKARNALPVMFPEWPRRGNTEEGPRVHQLHLDIASRQPACVAPIGLSWEVSLLENPDTILHAPDGNHSSLNGAALTAYVLYEVITGRPASELPDVFSLGVNANIQKSFRQIASRVVQENQAVCSRSELKVEPDSLDFSVSTSKAVGQKTLLLTSTGILDYRIDSITVPDLPFSLAGSGTCSVFPLRLAPTESCTIDVAFSPEYDGLYDATIELHSLAASQPVVGQSDRLSWRTCSYVEPMGHACHDNIAGNQRLGV